MLSQKANLAAFTVLMALSANLFLNVVRVHITKTGEDMFAKRMLSDLCGRMHCDRI